MFWLVSLVLWFAALGNELRQRRRAPNAGDGHRLGRGALITAIAVVAAVAAYGVVVKTVPGDTSSAPRLPDTIVLDIDHGTHALPVSRQTVSLDKDTVETTLLDFVDAQESLQPMSERDRRHAISAVRKGGYVPLSGLDAQYQVAKAYTTADGATVVSVPLVGTDLPEVSSVVFYTAGGQTSVTEMAARSLSDTEVSFSMWQDGLQTKNVVATNPAAADTGGGVVNVGLDWRKLNSCLNSIGVSWMIITIIGIVCAAACATAVACIPCIAAAAGFTGGTLTGCVYRAWT